MSYYEERVRELAKRIDVDFIALDRIIVHLSQYNGTWEETLTFFETNTQYLKNRL